MSAPTQYRLALRSRRVWVSTLVVVVWLGVMWSLWQRQSAATGSNLRELGVSPEVMLVTFYGYEEALWIERRGERVGASHLQINPVTLPEDGIRPERPGYEAESRTRMTFRMLGLPVPFSLHWIMQMNHAFELEQVVALIESGSLKLELEAHVQGLELFYRLATTGMPATGNPALAGLSEPIELAGRSPLRQPLVLREVVLPVLSQGHKFEAGKVWNVPVAMPLGGKIASQVTIRVEDQEPYEWNGERLQAWRVTESAGPLTSTVFYDDQGQLLERRIGEGYTLRRIPRKDYQALNEHLATLHPRRQMRGLGWIRENLDPELDGLPLDELSMGEALQALPRF